VSPTGYWQYSDGKLNLTGVAVERATLLDNADFFQAAHTAAASSGQSAVPTDLDVDTHFITFIEALNDKGSVSRIDQNRQVPDANLPRERRVVEMDGGRNGPFDRGACDDLLKVSHKSSWQIKLISR